MVNEFEAVGMRIDKSHLVKIHDTCTVEMANLDAKLYDLTGKKINMGSGDQLATLLFQELKLKNPGREKWTKNRSRLSTDSDVLKAMLACKKTSACDNPTVVIKTILDWKERQKIKSTYTYGLIEQADENERIHTDVSITRTGTGRLASSHPNLQNIPIRTDLGREIRNAFVPKKGNKIGSVDASQIEMRMNAVDAQCDNLLKVFWSWDDVYWDIAERVNRREFTKAMRKDVCTCVGCLTKMVAYPQEGGKTKYKCENDSCVATNKHLWYAKWYRQCAKVIALMVGYDASAGGLFDQFLSYGIAGWDEALCEKAIVDYFSKDAYWELLRRKTDHAKRAMKFGYVWDMWGFIRWIPQMKSVFRGVVNEGLRQAGNLAGQGGAAGIIKLWMAAIWPKYQSYWKKHGVLMLMQVHDELVAEGPERVLTDFFEWCKELLASLLPYDYFNCPLESNYGVAESWGVADH